jgi:hypothetical protein
MNDNQRLHLQKMISANNVEDNTDLIRELKHSHILRNDVNNLIMLKAKYIDNDEQLHLEAMSQCNFLFSYYTDIYNKIRKDEIDLQLLFNAFNVLRDIEDGVLDQHAGAFEFGNLLKTIYVDSALKKADKLNAEHDKNKNKDEKEYSGPQIDITWSDYKKNNKYKKDKV